MDWRNEGFFHHWGLSYEELREGIGNFSVALIEDEDGEIHTILPEHLIFIDKPQDDF